MASNSKEMMSWERFWAYFSSDFCDDEQRAWTLKSMNMVDILTGTTKDVQQEIIKFAPNYIKDTPEIQRVLGGQKKEEVRDNKPVMTFQRWKLENPNRY